jgi:hypothetical protein
MQRSAVADALRGRLPEMQARASRNYEFLRSVVG